VKDWDDGHPFTAPVGSFKPNPWGLHDMIGNAAEWTEDWYDADFYGKSPADDPKGPESGEQHVTRGGSWYNEPRHVRPAFRWTGVPSSYRSCDCGFRVVREP